MIKVSVLYPRKDGGKFDMNYYCTSHIPMVAQRLGPACKGVSVEQGLSGSVPGTQPDFVALGHILCDSVEAFQSAFVPHAAEIMGDIPNYTNIEPVVQISEVKL